MAEIDVKIIKQGGKFPGATMGKKVKKTKKSK